MPALAHAGSASAAAAAANGNDKVRSMVFVWAFAPEAGESAFALTGKFPGSSLPPTLAPPVPLAKAKLMAAGQRPVLEAALKEVSGEPAWKKLPSYFVYGKLDRKMPLAALSFMAERALSRHTLAIDGASHVVMTSHPLEVAKLIEEAAGAK